MEQVFLSISKQKVVCVDDMIKLPHYILCYSRFTKISNDALGDDTTIEMSERKFVNSRKTFW